MKFVVFGMGGHLMFSKLQNVDRKRVRMQYEWNYSFSHKFELTFNFNFSVFAFFGLICAIVASSQHKSKGPFIFYKYPRHSLFFAT